MSDGVDHYRAEFERVRSALPGDADLGAVREHALARFADAGFPGARDERWKYTRLDALARRRYATPDDVSLPAWLAQVPGATDETLYGLTFVNGRFTEDGTTLPAGVRATPLRAADGTAIAERLARADSGILPAFTALNTAFFHDGLLIELDAGATLDKPLVVRFVSDASEELAHHPRIVVNAGAGSSMTLVELHAGRGEAATFCNAVSDFELGESARVDHVKLHLESAKTSHIGAVRAELGRSAHFHHVALAYQGLLTRNDVEVLLNAEQAHARLHGLMIGDGRRHMDYHTLVEHVAPNARSEEVFKTVLDGRSRGVFDGAVKVHKGADGTDAEQRSNNLLLSADAEVDTKPQLEIYADDVKCSHGATVGQLDEQALFYLQARGVPPAEARAMLTVGFAQEIVETIEHDVVRALAGVLLDAALGHSPRAPDELG